MSDVIAFPGVTKLDTEPDQILEQALGRLESVVICGFDKDGNQYFASSVADGADALWHLERAKYALMKITDRLENGND